MTISLSGTQEMPDFDLSLLGYDRRQVQVCVADLLTQLREALEQLDANAVLQQQLRQAWGEIEELRQADRAASAEVPWGDRAGEILRIAQEQADALRAAAEQEAEQIRAQAMADSLQARRDLEAALAARRARDKRLEDLLPLTPEAQEAVNGQHREGPTNGRKRDRLSRASRR